MLVRTQAIVLRRLRYSDSSIIATLLTADRGVESIIAKGARSGKSRLAALLQPLEELELQYYVKPGRELHLLRSAERVHLRRRLLSSYDHALAGYAIAEIVLRIELPGHSSPEVFDLVRQALRALDQAENNPQVFLPAFALRYAAVHGFPLRIEGNAGTEHMAPSFPVLDSSLSAYALMMEEGRLCPIQTIQSGRVSPENMIEPAVVAMLATLQRCPWEELSSVAMDTAMLSACQTLAYRYLEYHFERRIQRSVH
ncbi:MAG: DNA repair protein RecO [Candidatus Kapabacteria bacterium]|nr:DNA repair protein RecO [Candidatus Kapabacteria bacterium]